VLGILICALALTLAYPIREYIAERRQIAELEAENAQLTGQQRHLKDEERALTSPTYVEQQARDQLHMCFPNQTCYVVVPASGHATAGHSRPTTPWYAVLWKSVREADKAGRR
jgi:cell division protein FtsB